MIISTPHSAFQEYGERVVKHEAYKSIVLYHVRLYDFRPISHTNT